VRLEHLAPTELRLSALGVPDGRFLCGLTFELTPRAEAGAVSLVRDDATAAADQAYSARRSESGVERVVRPHCAAAELREAQPCYRAWRALEVTHELALDAEAELLVEGARPDIAGSDIQGHGALKRRE